MFLKVVNIDTKSIQMQLRITPIVISYIMVATTPWNLVE
jgi:hypothetical protein